MEQMKKQTNENMNAIIQMLRNLNNEKGKLPSQTKINPKYNSRGVNLCEDDNINPVNAVTALRSRKRIDNNVGNPNNSSCKVGNPDLSSSSNVGTTNIPPSIPLSPSLSNAEHSSSSNDKRVYKPITPFPHRLNNKKKPTNIDKILEIFKQVRVNMPLLDTIEQIPQYAKCLKELCTQKRATNLLKTTFLTTNTSSIHSNLVPFKYKDPGCPTIKCKIGNTHINRALLDLGPSVNLLPYSVYYQLGLGEIKPTNITIQLADRSIKKPLGTVEDVLIQIEQFYFPVDFIVLQTEPISHPNGQIPLILGRPFLATSNAKINCRNGQLRLSFGNLTIDLNIFHLNKRPCDFEIEEVDAIQKIVDGTFSDTTESLNMFLDHFNLDFDESEYISEVNDLLDSCSTSLDFNQLMSTEIATEVHPKIDLQPLPKDLKYAYLDSGQEIPVILASDLNKDQENELLKVLRGNKEALGWVIYDIKGISPSICEHHIHMIDEAKPTREAQRRLNPNMREVVKEEIIKCLDNNIIYPISDSTWVSPVQVVPKKSGITVVTNENNELVPTKVKTKWCVCIDNRIFNSATRKDHFPLPFIDQMLERLVGHEYYCFLEGYSGYNQIPIVLEDQHKTTFTYPFRTFAYRRMPFGLCNAPATFQRCMMSIFSDMVEDFLEIFMDDFSIYGSSFD